MPDDRRFIKIKARYNGKCAECPARIEEGDDIVFDTKERKVYCATCGEDLE